MATYLFSVGDGRLFLLELSKGANFYGRRGEWLFGYYAGHHFA